MLFRFLSVAFVVSAASVAMPAVAVDQATFTEPRKVRLIVKSLDDKVTDEQVVECGVYPSSSMAVGLRVAQPCKGRLKLIYQGQVHSIGFRQRAMSGFLSLQLSNSVLFKFGAAGIGWTNWPADEPELWRKSKADNPVPIGQAAPILGDEQRREDPKPGERRHYLLTIGTITAVPVQN